MQGENEMEERSKEMKGGNRHWGRMYRRKENGEGKTGKKYG